MICCKKIKTNIKFTIIILFLIQKTGIAQTTSPPPIIWSKCFGGSLNDGNDNANSSAPWMTQIVTSDGGSAICARTGSNDGDIVGNHGGPTDVYFAKLDTLGNVQFSITLGGNGSDGVGQIVETDSNNFYLFGGTNSTNGDPTNYHGDGDIWITKITQAGIVLWSKCFGGSGDDGGGLVKLYHDESFILAGMTNSNNGDIIGYHQSSIPFPTTDVLLMKIDGNGSVISSKCLGGSDGEFLGSFIEIATDNFVVSGNTFSSDGDFNTNTNLSTNYIVYLDTGFHIQTILYGELGEISKDNGRLLVTNNTGITGGYGGIDINVEKYSSSGLISWSVLIGGSADERGNVYESSDSSVYVYGYTSSSDFDFIGNHGSVDLFLTKLDRNGVKLWSKCYGGTLDENNAVNSMAPPDIGIVESSNGNLLLFSRTKSNDGDVQGNHGGWDLWVILIDSSGVILAQNTIGGAQDEFAGSIEFITNTGAILTGLTQSNNGNISGNNGGTDLLVLKISNSGQFDWIKTLGSIGNDFYNGAFLRFNNGIIFSTVVNSGGGNTFNYHGGNDLWVVRLGNDPTATSIEDLTDDKGISVYPNPTNDQITVRVESSHIGSSYLITDIMGRFIQNGRITDENTTLSLQDISTGTYLLTIGNELKQTIRFVKE